MKHRRRPDRRPAVRWASLAALLLVALAAGNAVEHVLPGAEDGARPFERTGVVGEPLHLRYGTIEVGPPAGSTRLDTRDGAYSTAGVYVVVPITFTAEREPQSVSYVAIRDTQGRVFRAGSRRNPYSMGGLAQPGIPRHTQAAIEMPVDAVPGAEVVVALQPNDEDHRHDDVAVIDLGLTDAHAQAWQTDEDGVAVEPVYEGSGEPS
jgi:hypothetical protein